MLNISILLSIGGMTYCAVASYSLASRLHSIPNPDSLLRWLVDRQVPPPPPSATACSEDSLDEEEDIAVASILKEEDVPVKGIAGFQGRIGKDSDACYSFWCTAAIKVSIALVSIL